jgi:RNA polymerase sigma factor (sigma-70 family)
MEGKDRSERDMGSSRINHLIRYLRRMSGPTDGPALTDVQLLERFAFARDEAAFELLAWRHGPMVLGVCRRVLGDAHEAEDAFQATFLVLAKKAASAARHKSVGGWLYTVAYRAALRARARRAVRAARERLFDELLPVVAQDPLGEAAEREARQVIDEEVSRLPEKYRVPFVLYHLEGRSNAEIARELGCPVGTVESWLTRARARLRAALSHRGLAPTSALSASLAPQEAWLPQATQAAQAALAACRGVAGAVSAEAASLAAEVMSAFGIAKAKVVCTALLLALAAVGVSFAVGRYTPAEPLVQQREILAVAVPDRLPLEVPAKPPLPVQLKGPRGLIGGLNAVALTPDGKFLAYAAGADLKLWDVHTGKELAKFVRTAPPLPKEQLFAHEWEIHTLAFSPDGKTLASGSSDKSVKLWEVDSKKLAPCGSERATLQGHTAFIYSVAFSPDGKLLASAGGVQPAAFMSFERFDQIPKAPPVEIGEVKVWDLATRKDRTFYRGDTGRVTSIAFSPDSKSLACAGRDGTIRLWDVATAQERACLRENSSIVALAFSPDGQTLASVVHAQAEKINLWNLTTKKVRARLNAHAGSVIGIAFTPDGKTLASAGGVPSRDSKKLYDPTGEVRLWDPATGQQRGAPLTFPYYASSLALSARATILATGGPVGKGPGEVTVWDLAPSGGTAP